MTYNSLIFNDKFNLSTDPCLAYNNNKGNISNIY